MRLAPRPASFDDTADPERATFERLVERSVRLGHYKLALRHLLMMQALQLQPSSAHRAYFEAALQRCPARDLGRIRHAVAQWLRMREPVRRPVPSHHHLQASRYVQ
jgi:hypothetical protein